MRHLLKKRHKTAYAGARWGRSGKAVREKVRIYFKGGMSQTQQKNRFEKAQNGKYALFRGVTPRAGSADPSPSQM
jgi:hypothetical protein